MPKGRNRPGPKQKDDSPATDTAVAPTSVEIQDAHTVCLQETGGEQEPACVAPAREGQAEERLGLLKPWRRAFILSLRETPNIALACRVGNVSRQSADEAREHDPVFKELWNEAIAEASDNVEGALYDVAVNGHEKVYYGKDGEEKSREKVRDVNAMKFWLAGNRAKTYRETKEPSVAIHINANEVRLAQILGVAPLQAESGRELPAQPVEVSKVQETAQDVQSSDVA